MYWYMNFVICYLSIISFSYGINVETIRVNTTKGEVEGFIDKGGRNPVFVFKGIPFAEPPIGDLRFALPQSKTPWNSLLDAKNYQHACMINTSHAFKPTPNISEDCLYLNIWADKRCTQ
uniref:Carboxylesterase type B domain-containing protein n=1 Tax=Acrobeloides nanus TaxID=290746 RepID=A0A914D2H7_9BILA